MGSFKYNGISSEDLGLVIQTPPSYEFPERDVSTTHVPGRNGDLIIDNKCYKNVQRTYSIAKALDKGTNYYANSETVLKWLTSANGKYVRLEDSYDSEVYRLATFTSSGTFTNYFDQAEAISITFDCKPQRFFLIGEKETKYQGSESYIVNNYGYTSKPKITINNIPSELEDILMLTIRDKNEITSSITLSRIPDSTIILDTDDESAVDKNGNNISVYVGLNGKGFPKLNPGKNTFTFEKYEQERSILSSYTTVIAEKQQVATIKYTPYTALEEANQKKIKVISFDDLKAKNAETYYANAVQTFVTEKCIEYTFESFNTVMSNNSESIAFTGSKEDNEGTFPDWLEADYHTDSDGKEVVTLRVPAEKKAEDGSILFSGYGFYMCTNVDKKIYYRSHNDSDTRIIAENLPTSSVITVNYYKSTTDKKLDITYDVLPADYFGFRIEYDENSSPTKVIYTGVANGYYWTDKTWIFGKAKWQYSGPRDFTELKWNTSKKAFVSSGIFSSNTNASFTYRYIDKIPEYKDIEEVIINDDGRKTIITKSKCHFTVEDADSGDNRQLKNINIKAKEAGYYAIALNDKDPEAYDYKAASNIIKLIDGTSAFEIFYLSDVPTYINEDGWDNEIIDSVPIVKKGSAINPQELTFKVKREGYYRHSYLADDGTELYSDWTKEKLHPGDELPLIKPITSTDSLYICEIDEIPTTYDFDRSYNNSQEIPDYINVTYYSDSEMGKTITKEEYNEMTPEEKAKVTIKYTVAKAGYFKWDSNNNWMRKAVGDEIVICNIKDDTVIYYLEEIPEYEDYELENLFHMRANVDSSGNFTSVDYIIDEAGYYKYNNATDWKYYEKDEIMQTATVNSANTVYHLKKKQDSLDKIEMLVIPRWWSL